MAMHTLANLLLNTTTPQCPSAIGFLQNLAFRKPCSHHVAFGRHAWARGDAHRAFFHFLAAGEAGAEIALMNAHWILTRGCAPVAAAAGTATRVCPLFPQFSRVWARSFSLEALLCQFSSFSVLAEELGSRQVHRNPPCLEEPLHGRCALVLQRCSIVER